MESQIVTNEDVPQFVNMIIAFGIVVFSQLFSGVVVKVVGMAGAKFVCCFCLMFLLASQPCGKSLGRWHSSVV